jgi:hypothetical protein
LPLKAKWYEMIESGVKTEEYREVKPYWLKRLFRVIDMGFNFYEKIDDDCADFYTKNIDLLKIDWQFGGFQLKDYTHVKFSYGYTKRTMTFEIESINIGKGNPEWGAPTEDVFIIKLGTRV